MVLRFLFCLLLMVILSASCSSFLFQTEPIPSYKNPHTGCIHCHRNEGPLANLKSAEQPPARSAFCLDCHHYNKNHHPIDFIPDDSADFPLPLHNGRVTCLTCHEIHGGPDHNGTPRLLRGGPYQDRRTICFRCHLRDQYSTINPHSMLNRDGTFREINGKPACLLCHAATPDPSTDWTDDVTFRADVGFLCWRCHPPMHDEFLNQHFLVKPSARTLRLMEETEERELVIFPLVPWGRITCSTCHNPHQEGVLLDTAAAKGADTPDRLRLPSLCFACHTM